MKSQAGMNGVSTIPIPKFGCGIDQMNWQEVVKLLHNDFLPMFMFKSWFILTKKIEFTQRPPKSTRSSTLMTK